MFASDSARSATSRLAPLSGLLGILLLAVGWFWDPTPDVDYSDRQLDTWFATHSLTPWMIVSALQLLAVPPLWYFAGVVRARLAAGGAAPRTAAVAGSAAKGFAITVLGFAAWYAVIPFDWVVEHIPTSPEIYRFWNAADFSLYMFFSTVVVVALIAATSVAALRTRAVPLGLGIAAFPLGLITLANFLLPMAGITLWFLAMSITLAARPVRRAAAPATAQAQAATAVAGARP